MPPTLRPPARRPVMQVTQYDQVSSWLIAVVAGLVAIVFCLTAAWWALLPKPAARAVPVEIVELPGGEEDGAIDETLRVDSPAPESADATLAEVEAPETEVQETFDNVVDVADEAVNLADKTFELDARNAGKAGSAKGTGRRGLGMGKGGKGLPREQRWFIGYSDSSGLDEYARQLDFFGVELGALLPTGKMIYMSNLTAARPQVRESTSGGAEQRLYMIWQGGSRKKADLQLFQKAGFDVGGGIVFQFYPAATENLLAGLELDYRKRKASEIRRTYFAVKRDMGGYAFQVTRQIYFK